MSWAGDHELTVEHGSWDGARVILVCHAAQDAPCRRRPPDWEDREEWTFSEATLGGFPCWAVEFLNDGGIECLAYGGKELHDKPFTYAGPVEVTYEDGVIWREPQGLPS